MILDKEIFLILLAILIIDISSAILLPVKTYVNSNIIIDVCLLFILIWVYYKGN